MENQRMPVKVKPFKHQIEAFNFVLTLFDCLKGGKKADIEYISKCK